MKTILLFIFIFSSINVYSQWEKINDDNFFRVTKPIGVNGDSIYAFRDYYRWYASYDAGDTWVYENRNIFVRDDPNGGTLYPDIAFPYFKDNFVIFPDNGSNSIQISDDYGKTFKKANIINSHFNIFEVKYITTKDSLVLFGAKEGFYISYDYGKNFYLKDKPGVIQYGGDGYSLDPDELGFHIASPSNVDGILIMDDYILITSRGQGPAIFKTVKYEKLDSLNTKYYNVSYMYLINKFGDELAEDLYYSLKAHYLVEINNRIFTTFQNYWSIDNPKSYSQIWYSDDEGESWNELNTEEFGLNHIQYITKCGDVLYATQKEGLKVFMSKDLGETWELFNKGFNEFPDENNLHLNLGFPQFSDNFAYITNGLGLYRSPLKDCKIVSDISSVESASTEPQIYPNPASESITISGIGQGRVEIYNTLGQKLIEKEIFGTSTINTNELQTGLYVIKLESGGEVVFEKVIVNR